MVEISNTILLQCIVHCLLLASVTSHVTKRAKHQLTRDLSLEQQLKKPATGDLLLDEKLVQSARLTNSNNNKLIIKHDDDCYDRIRLPDHIRPMHYNLIIEPDMHNFTFQAAIDIDLDINTEKLIEVNLARLKASSGDTNDTQQPVVEAKSHKRKRRQEEQGEEQRSIKQNEIILHLDNLDIIDVWYSPMNNNKAMRVKEICISKKYQVAALSLDSNLIDGGGRLHINYKGIIRNDMKGFYRSEYINANNQLKYHATTQFQATDARSALPCFDEPAFKATFDIVLIAPKDRLVLANTHAIAELQINDGTRAVQFATTPLMSTYLLAFVIGEFDYIEGISRGRPIRVYTPLGKAKLGEFALDVALKCLPFLEDYFKIEFPLSKIDLVAIPDFDAGAMENWGLITYRETQLLIDEQHSSLYRRTLVAQTVAHELAHQWFGNLVTMSWWDDLWLNEGFATYMEFFVVGELFPEFSMMVNFVIEAHTPALSEDAMHSTHPIQATVGDPKEIEEIFDNISYFKGASTVKLLRDYLTDEVFRAGLQYYLSKNAYRNTVTNDLWEAFETVSGKSIKDMMHSWTNQAGFPCLDVSISKQDQESTELTIAQKRFVADGVYAPGEDRKAQWIIPLTIITGNDPNNVSHRSILSSKATKVSVKNEGQWIKLNPEFGGFYCVDYSKQLRAALYPAIKSKQLSVLDRMNLLTDAHSLTFAGKMTAEELLKMITYYKEEDDGAVWQVIDDVYSDMSGVIRATSALYKDKFKEFGKQLFENIYNHYGWDRKPTEPSATTIARSTILLTCLLDQYKPAIEEGLRRFNMHIAGKQQADPSIRGVIYYTAAEFGDDSQFNKLFELYNQTDLQETQNIIAYSIAKVEKHDRILKVIDWIMSDAVRDSQRSDYLTSISASDLGRKILWKMLDDNFYDFAKKFGLEILKKIIWVSIATFFFVASAFS